MSKESFDRWIPYVEIVGGFLFFVATLSLMKMSPPKNRRWRWVWSVLVRLTIFSWDAWGPTKLKRFGMVFPPLEEDEEDEDDEEPPTKKDKP